MAFRNTRRAIAAAEASDRFAQRPRLGTTARRQMGAFVGTGAQYAAISQGAASSESVQLIGSRSMWPSRLADRLD